MAKMYVIRKTQPDHQPDAQRLVVSLTAYHYHEGEELKRDEKIEYLNRVDHNFTYDYVEQGE